METCNPHWLALLFGTSLQNDQILLDLKAILNHTFQKPIHYESVALKKLLIKFFTLPLNYQEHKLEN